MINKIRHKIYEYIQYYQKKFALFFPEYSNFKYLRKVFFLKELYTQIEQLDGDIVECGVAYGNGLVTFAALAKSEGKGRNVYGFDSFEGFPVPSVFDKSPRNSKKGEYGDAKMDYVERVLKNANVGPVKLVKGYLENTGKEYTGKIALLYIDLDLYEGYKAVLEAMFDKVVEGGIIAFDEYDEPKWPGAKKAVDEFLSSLTKRYQLKRAKSLHKFYLIK
jgi:hypothetical protein